MDWTNNSLFEPVVIFFANINYIIPYFNYKEYSLVSLQLRF